MSHDTTSTSSEKQTSKGGSPQPDYTPFASYVRLFSYTYSTERVLNSIALVAALGSGVALALVNLIFGGLITILNDFVSGQATADGFRREVSQSA